MSCILRIIGEDLDVDEFIATNNIIPYKKSYKGQPRFVTKPDGEKLQYSYCSIMVSEADFEHFNVQVADAIHFLKDNADKFKTISANKSIQYAVLDFGVDHVAQFCRNITFPKELLRLAGQLGFDIELSIYQH